MSHWPSKKYVQTSALICTTFFSLPSLWICIGLRESNISNLVANRHSFHSWSSLTMTSCKTFRHLMIEFTLPVQIIWKAPLQFNGHWLISKMGDNEDDSMTWKDNAEPSISQSQKVFSPNRKLLTDLMKSYDKMEHRICSFTMFSFSEPIVRSREKQEQCQYHYKESLQMFQPSNIKCYRTGITISFT